MQPIWNGDRRDRVKWAAIYYLSGKYRIRDIVWVVFKREETDPTLCLYETDPTLQKPDSTMPIPDRVWSHFSDLERINELFDDGRTIHIFSEPFEHHSRKEYINSVITLLSRVRKPCLVFLDPDIGIDPSKATAECVTVDEIRKIWDRLKPHDILLVYQHANHAGNWQPNCEKLEDACHTHVSAIRSPTIADDVALLWATHQ